MRICKTILVGMILAAVIIPLPGHTASTSSPAPQTPAEPTAPAPTPAPAAAPTPVSTSAPAPAADAKPIEVVQNGELKLKLNFQDTPLQTVLEYLSETAGLTIVSNEPIAASRITLIRRQALPVKDAVEVINTALKEKGYNAILTGKTLKVVTLANIPKENTQVLTVRDVNDIQPSDSVVTCVIPVGHVTAVALLQNLQALLPEYANLTANADGNALILTDTKTNIRRLVQIVKALDTHMSTVAEIKVWPLYTADATSTAQLINTIFQQQAQGTAGRGGFGGRGGMGGNPFQMMMQMRGGGGPGGGRSQGGGSQQAGGSINVQVVAAADTQTNSIVVRGPGEALELVDKIINSLENIGKKVATVRVFQLRFADALNTADVVNQLFGSSGSSSRAGGRGGRGGGFMGGPMMFQGPLGQQGNGQGGSAMVAVTAAADSRTNTVVVTGPEAVLTVVDDVIKKLDQPLSNVADVKVFHLEYADASNSAQLINEVFGQSRTSSSSRSRSGSGMQPQQIQFMGGRGGFGGMMGGGPGGQSSTNGSDIAVVASADTRTNAVVVSGPPETLKVIEQIIKELDSNPEQERRIFVYPLKHGTATSLMTILNSLFQQIQTLNQRATGSRTSQAGGQRNAGAGMASAGGGGGGAAGAGGGTSSTSSGDSLSEETYFQADPNTNSLLVMTSSKNYDKVKPIIADLDKPVGQVLIKVLFAELKLTNDMDWGSEFAMLNLNRNGGVLTTQIFGRPDPLTATPDDATLGKGFANSEGLAVRILQGDLDLTLHALQEKGRLNVLSRPYVLTRNNRLATITVADEVPIPTGTTTVAGQTQVTFDYRSDIGIVLNVTPSINDDGLVNMIIQPKITTDTKQVVSLGAGLEPHIFSTRSATTRVAVKDAQTIVIGGLIQDQSSDTVRKVPLLGDIPLVGELFKRTIKSTSKIELLIFLTPYVAKEPEQLTGISATEEQRSMLSQDKEAGELYRRHMSAMRQEVVDPNQSQP